MIELRKSLIAKALELVHTEGWEGSLFKASGEMNLSPAIVSQLFPNGPYDLIHSLMLQWNEQLYIDFKLSSELSHSSLYLATRKRLEYMLPYSAIWLQAMSIGARPSNLLTTTNTLWTTFDSIFKIAGEQHFDLLYPIKRTNLAVLYLSTEVRIVRNPSNTEELFADLESKIIRSCQGGMIVENLWEVAKFVGNANYRILQSFYPEPKEHKNPINKG